MGDQKYLISYDQRFREALKDVLRKASGSSFYVPGCRMSSEIDQEKRC